ncbi:TPA: helix-turn-helix domain-containing protein [Escherichia coli]|nr:helix-turn-helix domain-containing protein [Escherichia coli]
MHYQLLHEYGDDIAAGMAINKANVKYGLPTGTALRLRHLHDLPVRQHLSNAERWQQIKSLVEPGKTIREIASQTGISKSQVHRLMQKYT